MFVEELSKSVLEALAGRLVVPATLQDSLMARLDRLGSAKEIAQIAAVIGPRFSHALLAYVAPCDADKLVAALGRLPRVPPVAHRRARLRAGREADALALLDAAIATITEPGVGLFISELHRVRGESLLAGNGASRDAGLAALHTAVDIARQQGAALLELSARTSLAAAQPPGSNALTDLRVFLAGLPDAFEAPRLAEARRLASA